MHPFQPVPNEPALLCGKTKALIVADLHIGIERELREAGLSIPSQTRAMEARLHTLIAAQGIVDLYLLGDVKHNVPSSTAQERTDVRFFLKRLSEKTTVHILPGNHDGSIDYLISDAIRLHPSSGLALGETGLVHGHRWPSSALAGCRQLIVAHTHPTVQFTDRLGYKCYEPCWLRGPCLAEKASQRGLTSCDQLIVVPAFNPLCGGIAVNTESLLGPVASLLDTSQADVYLLDGTCLGRVSDLEEPARKLK